VYKVYHKNEVYEMSKINKKSQITNRKLQITNIGKQNSTVKKSTNKKLLWMLHGSRGAVFSKRAPLAKKIKKSIEDFS
jgi:hypothetical protein